VHARRHRRRADNRGLRPGRGKLAMPRPSTSNASTDSSLMNILQSLQGSWVDDKGHGIQIEGEEVRDHTSTVRRVALTDDTIMLEDWRLVGSPISPVWQSKAGAQWRWARPDPQGFGDKEWEQLFHRYKSERLTVRRQLHGTFSRVDLERITLMQKAWNGGFGFPMSAPAQLRERLLLGRYFVPGSCVIHRKLGYRGVILACEPWCKASAQWRAATGTAKLIHGDKQPFYHCAVDRRDEPGNHVAFVAEEDLEVSIAFPIDAPLVESLFTLSEPLGAYLPAATLVKALQLHRSGQPFEVPVLNSEA